MHGYLKCAQVSEMKFQEILGVACELTIIFHKPEIPSKKI
jgi:hypothetical protein